MAAACKFLKRLNCATAARFAGISGLSSKSDGDAVYTKEGQRLLANRRMALAVIAPQ